MVQAKVQGLLSQKIRRNIFAMLFSAPAIIIYTMFILVPMIGVVALSFAKWNGAGPITFVGLSNLITLFSANSEFFKVLSNSLVLITLTLLIQIPVALLLSFLLYRTARGSHFFRSVYFLPSVIAATCIALMFSIMLNGDIGPVNSILRSLGLNHFAMNWLSDPTLALLSVSLITVWQYIGYRVTLLLAGMQTVPEEIFESAIIDGASSIGLFFYIMLPMIKSVLKVTLIFAITGCLRHFEQAFIMTWGGPGLSTTFPTIYMWKTAYLKGDLGMGTAIAMVIVILAILFHKSIDRFIKED
jgi:raffinose/stachyose/melibiose transport system permease protein